MNTREMYDELKKAVKRTAPEKLALIDKPNQELVCVYPKSELEKALEFTAWRIAQDFKGKNPIMLCLLNGALMSYAYVATHLGNGFMMTMDYARPCSYHGDMTGGELEWKEKPHVDMTDRYVIIWDDIIDKARTMRAAIDFCRAQKAAAVFTGVMLDKQCERAPGCNIKPNYAALTVADYFVLGYGLDYANLGRHWDGIYAIKTKTIGLEPSEQEPLSPHRSSASLFTKMDLTGDYIPLPELADDQVRLSL